MSKNKFSQIITFTLVLPAVLLFLVLPFFIHLFLFPQTRLPNSLPTNPISADEVSCSILFYKNSKKIGETTGIIGKTYGECENWITSLEGDSPKLCFLGWYRSSDTTKTIISPTDIIQESHVTNGKIKLYASFGYPTYTVTLSATDSDICASEWDWENANIEVWHCNGNSCSQPYQMDGSNKITIGKMPNAKRTGYEFNGWYDKVGNKVTITREVSASVTYTAQWTACTYDVVLQTNGEQQTIKMTYGKEYAQPLELSPAITKEHYDFLGYYNKTQGGDCYFDSTGKSVKEWDIANNETVLYPRYQPKEYTLNYELNGGEIEGTNPLTYNIETETFILSNPTKHGMRFMGWRSEENQAPQKIVEIKKGTYGNRLYTAVYEEENTNCECCKLRFTCTNQTDYIILIDVLNKNNEVLASTVMDNNITAEMSLQNGINECRIIFIRSTYDRIVVEENSNLEIKDNEVIIRNLQPQTYEIRFTTTNVNITNFIVI